jgi:selenocysteine-specific elongation factor
MKDILGFMIETGELVDLPGGLLLLGKDFESISGRIIETIKSNGKIDVAGVRELSGFSRKYSVPLLEKLDSMKLTRRVGDHRVLL